MEPASRIAFKEWAAVCAALAAGRQSLIVRKGGIHDSGGQFHPEHGEFWLLPTRFHERPDLLRPTDRQYFDAAQADVPPADAVRIGLYAIVGEVIEMRDEARLTALEGWHVYGHATVRERFHYRRPGLFVLGVRIYRAAQPFDIPAWPELAGCKTWVELPGELPTAGLVRVLPDDDFARRMDDLRAAAG